MNDWLLLILLFLTGALLAVIYLGGLWLTVQRLQHCRYPALCLMTSMLVRMLLLLTAFYFILGDGHWPRLLAVLAGFVTLRLFITGRLGSRGMTAGDNKEKAL